jgi:hypothetical protein
MLLYAAAESASQGGGAQTFANTLGMLGAHNEAGFFNPGGQGGLERNLGGGLELPYGTLGGESSYSQTPGEERGHAGVWLQNCLGLGVLFRRNRGGGKQFAIL